MTITEVCEILKVHPTTIYLWIKQKKIRATKDGKSYSFDKVEVERVKSLLDRGSRLPIIPGVVDLSKVEVTKVEITKTPDYYNEVTPGEPVSVSFNLTPPQKEAAKVVLELRSTLGQVDDNWGVKSKIQKAIDFIVREYQL